MLSQMVVMVTCRTGRCEAQAKGRCQLGHDPTKVAVCQRWLLGNCNTVACPLQHSRCPEVMPVCTFFLQVSQGSRLSIDMGLITSGEPAFLSCC